MLGRVIYLLILLHVVNYFNLLYLLGRLPGRLFDPIVIPGELSNISYTLLFATALPKVREYSYRLFFITHLAVVFATSLFLFNHAPSARFYITKALIVFMADLAARKFTTTTAEAKVEAVPGTNLIRISAKLPPRKIAQFAESPGSHVYVSIPWGARPQGLSSLIYEFRFTSATVKGLKQNSYMREERPCGRAPQGMLTYTCDPGLSANWAIFRGGSFAEIRIRFVPGTASTFASAVVVVNLRAARSATKTISALVM